MRLTGGVLLLTFAGIGTVAHAQAQDAARQSETCQSAFHDYGETEKFVWDAVCRGERADLTKAGVSKVVQARFIRDILTDKRYRNQIGSRGVAITGAIFDTQLDLKDVSIEHPLRLEEARFLVPPTFVGFRSTHDLSLAHATLCCTTDDRLYFARARVDGDLDLRGTTFNCIVDMGHARIGGSLYMHKDGNVPANYVRVVLSNAGVAGKVSMEGAAASELDLVKLKVGSDLAMQGGGAFTTVKASAASIGGKLDIVGSRIERLDLTGAHVDGVFRFDEGPWPKSLELLDMTFGSIMICPTRGCPDVGAEESPEVRKALLNKLENWLKVTVYSRQPYDHLAKLLERKGYVEEADELRYEERERERERTSGLNWIWQTWQKGFTGYGYRKHYVLVWTIVLVALGAVVFKYSPEGRGFTKAQAVIFSFDKLLPGVQLERTTDLPLHHWQRYYFYFQRLMGWMLAAFLLAAVTGLRI